MAKKSKEYKCCFCGNKVPEDMGAFNEDETKALCLDCVLSIYDIMKKEENRLYKEIMVEDK